MSPACSKARMFEVIRIDLALINCTYSDNISMTQLFHLIEERLRSDKWIVIFKSLSLIHLLIREGNSERVLQHLCNNHELLRHTAFRGQEFEEACWINTYSFYLEEKSMCFKSMKKDWVKRKDEQIAIFRGEVNVEIILNDVEILQRQIAAVVCCNWDVKGISDLVLQQGYRFIVTEILALFHLANESMVVILGLYFKMDYNNASKALVIYKTFTTQARKIQQIFDVVSIHKYSLMIEVPNIKPVFLD
jgi:hypothetical protein